MTGSRATGKVISYVGTADVRELPVEGKETIVFNRENNWTVPASDVPSELEEILKASHSDEFTFGSDEEAELTLAEKEALAAAKGQLDQHQPPSSDA
jgi:hypothetical protein